MSQRCSLRCVPSWWGSSAKMLILSTFFGICFLHQKDQSSKSFNRIRYRTHQFQKRLLPPRPNMPWLRSRSLIRSLRYFCQLNPSVVIVTLWDIFWTLWVISKCSKTIWDGFKQSRELSHVLWNFKNPDSLRFGMFSDLSGCWHMFQISLGSLIKV